MKEYVFSFSNVMELNEKECDVIDETVYGTYSSEKEAILDAMKEYKYYEGKFTHLFVGQAEYFVPRIDSDVVLEDLATRANDNGYEDDEYLTNVKNEHVMELDKILTEAYLNWENKHPEYRNSNYLMAHAVRYSIGDLKEKMKNKRKEE